MLNFREKYQYFLFFFFLTNSIFSQNLKITGQFSNGKMNKSTFAKLDVEKRSSFYEINFSKQMDGSKYWHRNYNFAQLGISFQFGDLGDDYFGNSYGVFPSLSVPFYPLNDSSWKLRFKYVFGVAFFDKPYHPINNPDNIQIGSRVSIDTYGELMVEKDFSEKFGAFLGFSFLHFSNGHTQIPNLGANVPMFNLGVAYHPFGRIKIDKNQKYLEPNFNWKKNARLSLGVHEYGSHAEPAGSPLYPIYSGSFFMSKRIKPIRNIQIGLDINYYTSFYDFIINQELFTKNEKGNSFNVVVFWGHEYLIGKLSFITQFGINIYKPYAWRFNKIVGSSSFNSVLKAISSNKFGVQYYLKDPTEINSKNYYINFCVKTNAGQADFTELGVGVVF